MTNLEICMACKLREQGTGRLKCLSPTSGKPFYDHAIAGDCPEGHHDGKPLPPQVAVPLRRTLGHDPDAQMATAKPICEGCSLFRQFQANGSYVNCAHPKVNCCGGRGEVGLKWGRCPAGKWG